ncbi:hypothetical protein DVJ78_11745 [Humibacter sp. BT305]|nr:hypothetical protein DVJ78_11745 [Humibacter sp. BT305]
MAAIVAAALAGLVMLPMVLFGAGLALDGVLPLWLVQSMLLDSMGAAYAYPAIFALFGILVVVSLALATAAAFGRGRWAGRAFIVVGVAGLLAVPGVGGTILGSLVPARS